MLELLLGSAMLVAITVKVPAVAAENSPVELIEPPPETPHVKVALAAPATEELN